MSYKSHFTDRVLFVRWAEPLHTDFTSLVREVQMQHMANGSKKLVAVFTIIPPDMSLPDEQFRKTSASSMTQIATYVENFVAVLEGQGLKYSVMRSAASLMSTVSNLSSRSHVVSSVEEGLTRIGDKLDVPPPNVLTKLRQQGLTA